MTPSLQTLKILFADRPEVLRVLDHRELDLQELTDVKLMESYQKQKLYPTPVNLYVTGRTGAGKSSLGNRFLERSPLVTTGQQDCTAVVQYFQLASNLVYFDLPGSGSSDFFENINRAALLVKQLEDEFSLKPTGIVPTVDFTPYLETGRLPNLNDDLQRISVDVWQGEDHQMTFAPDVILYVVAPHVQWLRTDRVYLRDLLRARRAAGKPANVVFALNHFRKPDGGLVPTEVNIADVKRLITEDWQMVYPGESPLMIDVNSRTGAGLQALAAAMCRVLPPQKISNMGAALTQDLRQAATLERSRRFRRFLVNVAARLATFKVDASAGREDLLQVAFEAICDYAIEVFHEEAAIREAQAEVIALVTRATVSQTRQDRSKDLTTTTKDVEHHEQQVEEFVSTPELVEENVEEKVPDYEVRTERKQRSAPVRVGLGIGKTVAHVLASPIGLFSRLFGAKRTIHDAIEETYERVSTYDEKVLEAGTKTVTRLRQRLKGIRQEKVMVTRMVPRIVTREEKVGTEFLTGGSRVIEDLLALGLAIEQLPPGSDLRVSFEPAVVQARQQVQERLAVLAARLDAAAAIPDPASAEKQLIAFLQPVFVP